MRVTDFKEKKGPKNTVFSAKFNFRNKKLNQKVWFKIPNEYSEDVDLHNPFFVTAVPLALALGEDLLFEGKVSKKLYKNLLNIDNYLKVGYRKIKISTRGLVVQKEKGKKVGLFFSLGADSFYSLVDNEQSETNEKIGYLIFVNGIETFKSINKLVNKVKKGMFLVSKRSKKTIIVVKTNIRSLSDKIINWKLYHGAAIVACSLLLSALLKKIYINSSEQYILNNKPHGTGRNIDYKWSTEGLKFEPYGKNVCRADKIIKLSQSRYIDLIKKYLWTCWQKINNKDLINCSKCEKCIRTYLSFRAAGITGEIPILARPKQKDIRKIYIQDDFLMTYETAYELLKTNENVDKRTIRSLIYILEKKKRNRFYDKLNRMILILKQTIKKKYLKFSTIVYDKFTGQNNRF